MGHTTPVIVGVLVVLCLLLGGYAVTVTREAAANAQRIEDQAREIDRLTTALQLRSRQIARSEADLARFKADHAARQQAHQEQTRRMKETISALGTTAGRLEADLAARVAEADRLRGEIRRHQAAAERLENDRETERRGREDLQAVIARLEEELAANEIVIAELKNDREAITCLERDVPGVVLERLLGRGVRVGETGRDRAPADTR